ncbi:TetR/AcrR family transcriptional regulator [Idiomarina xiamenensis]|uniref:TetR family transcriptional regulator n=1 Tax=Idiomarina xiamenensis 10-D-4 TaxID=740709 RepID=K2KJL1_9GAMM|nr:TetR/AcrR family transcriptional regulator [Idiomarina xiamenensis]EKE82774.1 TetR family transcriptional regulator [Idiomarina xiamenensis 10-D-4]
MTTKDKIVNAAEALFAEHGFEQTSLRQITSEAGVNLASVNYHFGSKKALIQAVMARYLSRFMPALARQLQSLENYQQVTSRAVFDCFRQPLMALTDVSRQGPANFLRLLGFAYSEIQGHLRKYTMTEFGTVIEQLLQWLHRANPQLSDAELFWRLHFILGATVFAQVSSQALIEIAAADFDEQVDPEHIIDKLIPFIAGGLDSSAAG